MPIKVYNSLTRKKEDFVPVEEGKVRMYVCGPTVYALSHIGHARSAVSFDVIYKYLKYSGYEVKYARNYTDVDDKIINRANEEGVSSEELAERYIKAFDEDMEALGVEVPTFRPKATSTIKKIIEVTETLINKGSAYELNGDVYYSVRLKKDYGKLSGKNIDDLESGARVDVDERKKDPLDFALWKSSARRTRVGLALVQGQARLAHRVLGDVHGMARRDYRHTRRRKGLHIPAPRKRNRPERGGDRQDSLCEVLAP